MNWTLRRRPAPRRTVSGVEGLPAGSALLVVKRGPNAGSRFLLDQPTTSAGRHPDSDIFLDDVTVSRRHAEFRLETDEFHVVDVGSLNGTYVNREPVDSAVLANGDEVQIGKFRLVFLTGPKSRRRRRVRRLVTAPETPALSGMSIGAVLDLLRPDFPDVTISKIRFLEAEGLVTPQRAASGIAGSLPTTALVCASS